MNGARRDPRRKAQMSPAPRYRRHLGSHVPGGVAEEILAAEFDAAAAISAANARLAIRGSLISRLRAADA